MQKQIARYVANGWVACKNFFYLCLLYYKNHGLAGIENVIWSCIILCSYTLYACDNFTNLLQ